MINIQFLLERVLFLVSLVFEAIADEYPVQVIHFVLNDDGEESGSTLFYFLAIFVFVTHGDALGSFNEKVFSRETQTAFLEEDFFTRIRSDFRVDHDGSFSFDLDDGETNGTVDLGRGKPDTLRDAQRIKHKRNEVLDIRIKRIFYPIGFAMEYFGIFAGHDGKERHMRFRSMVHARERSRKIVSNMDNDGV